MKDREGARRIDLLLVRGKIELPEAFRYWAAQIVGGIVAAGVLLAIVAGRKGGYHAGSEGLGANGYGAHSPGGYPWGSAFVIGIPVSNLSVNPARSIGPAIFVGGCSCGKDCPSGGRDPKRQRHRDRQHGRTPQRSDRENATNDQDAAADDAENSAGRVRLGDHQDGAYEQEH